MRIGFGIFCSTSDGSLSTNHRITLAKLSEEVLFKVFRRNLDDFIKLLELSREMGFTIFRLGSGFIPFASHPKFRREWFIRIEEVLSRMSSIIRGFGIRVTMHPGQFVVLNSPSLEVRSRSLKEIEYHFKLLDVLGFGFDSVVVVHVGGVYGDKREALRNLYSVFEENRWLLKRIALENDERYYTVQEVLEIAESFSIPVVYDHYHHKLNPSRFSIGRLLATWRNTTPEVHISSQPISVHRFGEHGDYVRVEDFVEMVSMFPEDVALDVIPEVKMKEKAISKLVRELQTSYPRIARRVTVKQ